MNIFFFVNQQQLLRLACGHNKADNFPSIFKELMGIALIRKQTEIAAD